MFIAYDKITKQVVGKPTKTNFAKLSQDLSVVECENVPTNYDYLTVENVRQVSKNGKTYNTCDLVGHFYEYTAEQLEAMKERKHKELSKRYIRQKYPLEDENKIMRRYLASPSNPQYKLDFLEYNEYVEKCILRASEELNK